MMNNKMSTWFLDKTVGFSEETNRSLVKKALMPVMDKIAEGTNLLESNPILGQNVLKKAITSGKNALYNVFNEASNGGLRGYWEVSMIEGVEEVTEQMVMDATKGAIDVASSLGLTKKQGSFGGWDTVFSKAGLENYVSNLVGGMIGGPMFKMNEKLIEPMFKGGIAQPEDEYSMYSMIANGKTDEALTMAENMRGYVGNKFLATGTTTIDGKQIFNAAGDAKTHADLIVDGTKEYIKTLDSIFNQEGLKVDDTSLFNKALLNQYMIPELEKSGVDKLIISDFNKTAGQIVQLRSELKDLESAPVTAEGATGIALKKAELDEKRLSIQEITNGDKSDDYLMKSLLYLIPDMHKPFIALNKEQYTQANYDKSYFDLPDSGVGVTKKSVTTNFDEYIKNPDIVSNLDTILGAYKNAQGIFSNTIKEYAESKYKDVRSAAFKNLYNLTGQFDLVENFKANNGAFREISKSAANNNLKNFSVNDMFDYDINEYLGKEGLIDNSIVIDPANDPIAEKYKTFVQQIPMQEMNVKFLQDTVKDFFANIISEGNNKEYLLETTPENIATASPEAIAFRTNFNALQDKYYKPLQNYNKPLQKFDFQLKMLVNALSESKVSTIDNEVLIGINKKLTASFNESKKSLNNELKSPTIQTNIGDMSLDNILGIISEATIPDPTSTDFQFNDSSAINVRLQEKIDAGQTHSEAVAEVKGELKQFIKNKFKSEINPLSENDYLLGELTNSQKTIDNYIDDQFKLNDTFDKFDKYVSKKTAIANPLYDFLRKLQLKLDKGTSKTVFNILEDEDNLLSMSIIDDYLKSDFTLGQINSAITTIEMAKSILTGMYTKQGALIDGKETMYGFNYAMQNYLKKYKESTGLDNYAIIKSEDASLINTDLNNLLSKLVFLKDLSNSNTESKAKEHILSRENMDKLFLDLLDKQDFQYKGKPLIADKDTILNLPISQEAKLLKCQDSIFENFKDTLPENYAAGLEEIFKDFDFNAVFNGDSNGISSTTQVLSQYDIFINMLTNLSLRSTEVQERNKRIIESPEFNYAPFYGQEYAAKIALALVKNPKLFYEAQELIYRKVNGEQSQLKPGAFNLMSITGVAGSGKTSVVGQFILKYMLQDDAKSNIIISSPTATQTKGLQNSLLSTFSEDEVKKLNQTTKTTEEIFNKFLQFNYADFKNEIKTVSFGNKKTYKFFDEVEINGNTTLVLKNNQINYKYLNKLDTPKAIFLDEGTHYNSLELALFANISKKFGFPFIIFGDKTQNGAMINNNSFNLNRIFTLNSPVLTSSIRASNIHQHDNNFKLALASSSVIRAVAMSPGLDPELDQENAVKRLDELDITLNYFQDKNVFNGGKIVSSITDEDLTTIKEALDRTLIDNPTAKVGIITDKGEIDDNLVIQLAKVGITPDHYIFYSSDNNGTNPMQGNQEEFMIIDKDLTINSNNRIETFFQDMNTLGSRAFQGSLILDKNGILNQFNIKNKKEDYTSERRLGEKIINDVKELRKKDFVDMGIKDYIPTTTITPVVKNPITTQQPIVDKKLQDKLDELKNPLVIVNNFGKKETAETDTDGITKNLTPEERKNNLMIHAFYNHLSVPVDEHQHLLEQTGNENLQLLSHNNGDLFDSKLVNTFIEFKNIVSLYYDNEEILTKLLIGDSIKESKFTDLMSKLGITDVNLLISSMKSNIKVVGNRYINNIDDPRFKAGFDATKTLTGDGNIGDDIFLRLVLKLNLENNKVGYITIGALPTLDTLTKSFTSKTGIVDQETIDLFSSMNKKVNTTLLNNDTDQSTTNKNPIIELDFNGDIVRKFTSGLRFIESSQNISADSLQILHPDIKIETQITNGIETIPIFGGLNVYKNDSYNDQTIEQTILKYGYNRDPKYRIDADTLASYRSRPYVIVSFSGENGNEFKKLIVLTPKTRGYEDLTSEFKEIKDNLYDKEEKFENINNNYSFNVSKLFSKYTGFEMFYNIKSSNINNMQSIVELFKSQINKFYAGNTTKINKINGELDLLNKFNSPAEFTKYIKDNVLAFPEFNVGQIIMTTLDAMDKSSDKEIFKDTIETIKNSLTSKNGQDLVYAYNGRPYSLGITEDMLGISIDDLKYFEMNIIPEMPRYVVDFSNININQKVLNIPVNPIVNNNSGTDNYITKAEISTQGDLDIYVTGESGQKFRINVNPTGVYDIHLINKFDDSYHLSIEPYTDTQIHNLVTKYVSTDTQSMIDKWIQYSNDNSTLEQFRIFKNEELEPYISKLNKNPEILLPEILPPNVDEKTNYINNLSNKAIENNLTNNLIPALTSRFNIADINNYYKSIYYGDFYEKLMNYKTDLSNILSKLNVVDGNFQPTGETPIEEVIKNVKDSFSTLIDPLLKGIQNYQEVMGEEVKDARLRKVKMDLINELTLDLKLKDC